MATATKYTYDDYVLMPDDRLRREIIDGNLYVTPTPNIKHQAVSRNLLFRLARHIRDQSLGYLYDAPCNVIFSDTNVVQPDIVYVSNERADEIITEKNIRGVPDLVVEILSDSSRKTDQTIKCSLYERFGVPEYWIVDPVADTIKIYRREGAAYRRVAELNNAAGDVLTTPLLPELRLSLSDVFTSR